MRKPVKKWRKAYDLYVNYNFSISTISSALHISTYTLQQWRYKYNWDRHRTLIMLNGKHLAELYIDRCTDIINQATEWSRYLTADELRQISILARGYYAMQRKPTPVALTGAVLNFYKLVHKSRPELGRHIRGYVRQYLNTALDDYNPNGKKVQELKLMVNNKFQNPDTEQWASLPQ